jgi:hypothetical protein
VRHGGFMRLPEDFMQGFARGQVFMRRRKKVE